MSIRCPQLLAVLAMLLCSYAQAQQTALTAQKPKKSAAEGLLSPWKVCRVAFAETGLIQEHFVAPGAVVQVGQKLASLDTDQQQLLVQMAKIQAEARGKLDSATAEVELQSRKMAAIEAGRSKNFTTQTELERAEVELRISRGKLDSERDQFQVEQLNLKKLQTQLSQRTAYAPITGTVVRMLKEVGEFVAPTSPEVMEIVDTSRLRATFFLSIEEVRQLHRSGKSSVAIDDETTLPAELEYVAPVADGESGLIEVRMLIENPSRQILGSRCTLMIGQSADSART